MWIICWADDSHEMSALFPWQKNIKQQNIRKKIKMSSAAILISTLKIKFKS